MGEVTHNFKFSQFMCWKIMKLLFSHITN